MSAVVGDLGTTGEKIRALLRAGHYRTDIAEFLNVRYQQVRRVAVDAGMRGGVQRGVELSEQARARPKLPEGVAVGFLIDAGFKRIGAWIADGIGGVILDTPPPGDPGVYAFVVGGMVKYIGVSQAGVRHAMADYRLRLMRGGSRARVILTVSDHVTAGTVVEIFVANPPPLQWNGLPVATAEGLEAGLIKMIQPPWNRLD